jgi:hypothetical protein
MSTSTSSSGAGGNDIDKLDVKSKKEKLTVGEIFEFNCYYSDHSARTLVWYFGDGSSAACPSKPDNRNFYGSVSHSYSQPGEYYAYAKINGKTVVARINVVVGSGSASLPAGGMVFGFGLLGLGAAAHAASRRKDEIG